MTKDEELAFYKREAERLADKLAQLRQAVDKAVARLYEALSAGLFD